MSKTGEAKTFHVCPLGVNGQGTVAYYHRWRVQVPVIVMDERLFDRLKDRLRFAKAGGA